jgi:hypothetical protein
VRLVIRARRFDETFANVRRARASTQSVDGIERNDQYRDDAHAS